METPHLIRTVGTDLERRYSGPIPRAARREALLPQHYPSAGLGEIEEMIAWTRWRARSALKTLSATARWARSSRGESGLTAILDRERHHIAVRQVVEARRLRDAWIAARRRYLGLDTLPSTDGASAEPDPGSERACTAQAAE